MIVKVMGYFLTRDIEMETEEFNSIKEYYDSLIESQIKTIENMHEKLKESISDLDVIPAKEKDIPGDSHLSALDKRSNFCYYLRNEQRILKKIFDLIGDVKHNRQLYLESLDD